MKKVVLPILICVAFLAALAIGIIAMPQDQQEPTKFSKQDMEWVYLGGDGPSNLCLKWTSNDTVHIIREQSITAMMEHSPATQELLGFESIIYFAGGQMGSPYTVAEYVEARNKFNDSGRTSSGGD